MTLNHSAQNVLLSKRISREGRYNGRKFLLSYNYRNNLSAWKGEHGCRSPLKGVFSAEVGSILKILEAAKRNFFWLL